MKRRIHPAAARGFQVGADAYERGRPGYPEDAVAFLVKALAVGPGKLVVDLAAGTGKLTRMLAGTGADIVAVEPVEAMRAKLEEVVPDAAVLDGTAESMPLPDARADAITVAQSFHWFDARGAIDEIARVLRAGGRLGLIWNVRDESVAWVAALTEIMEPYRRDTPTYRSQSWRAGFEGNPLLTPLAERSFRHEHRLTPDGVIDRVLSVSFIAALADHQRLRVTNAVKRLLETNRRTAGRREVSLPYRTDVFWCERR